MVECAMSKKGYKQTPEHIAKRFASMKANGSHGGWPAGVPRTEETKAAIRAGMKVSPTQQARRVFKVCPKCGEKFKSLNAGQVHCSRGCAYTGRIVVDGYVKLRVDGRYVLEHRLVMAQVLGRELTSDESVHHRDGDRQNNDPSNLELRTRYHGKGATNHCPTCTCGVTVAVTQT